MCFFIYPLLHKIKINYQARTFEKVVNQQCLNPSKIKNIQETVRSPIFIFLSSVILSSSKSIPSNPLIILKHTLSVTYREYKEVLVNE